LVRGLRDNETVQDRLIAHLDLDAFYATVELMRRPELKGLPVIVAGSGPRAVVTTASYEARRFGVGSAMPASRARRLCPDAIVIPPDFDAYRDVSRQVMALVRDAVERTEVVGLDEAYLELTGLVAPKATMRRLVGSIRDRTGMSASVGIGPNKLVAKVASDAEKPAGFVVLSREEACERFAGARPGLVPGIGPKTAARLEAMGITTLGDLAATSDELLAEAFGGRLGPWLRGRARFESSDPVEPVRIAVSESRETTFDVDIADAAEQEAVLMRLATRLCGDLARQDRRGRTIAIKVRLSDFTTVTRARTIPQATNELGVIGAIAVELLREYAPPKPVRLLGVRVASFEQSETQAATDSQMALPV
jgi:DNA polymerase-4